MRVILGFYDLIIVLEPEALQEGFRNLWLGARNGMLLMHLGI